MIFNLNGDCISQDDNYKDDMFFWIKYPDTEYTIVPCEGLQPILSKKK